jgi:hypothetical protein
VIAKQGKNRRESTVYTQYMSTLEAIVGADFTRADAVANSLHPPFVWQAG